MTDGPVSPQRRRRPLHTAVALCIVLVAISLAVQTIIPSASAENADVTPAISPFITIDPIGDHMIGEVFFINGTTNLPVSEKLIMNIESSEWVRRTHTKFSAHPPSGEYAYDIPVSLKTSDSPGTNRWSVTLTDIAKTLVSQKYIVDVVSHDTGTNALFTILPVNYSTTSTMLQTTVQSPSPVQPTTCAVIVPPTTQKTPLPLALPIAVLAILVILISFRQH